MNDTIAQLKHRFQQALVAAFGEEWSGTDPILVAASNPKFGDLQSNLAMSLTKQLGKPPRAIAETIVQNLDVAEICEAVSIAGPGFINLRFKPNYLEAQLKAIQVDPRLGIAPTPQPQRVIVDYPSPNIAKEMHVGHLRPSVIGDCIARILEFMGHEVLRLNHIGDWGTSFGMLIAYLQAAYPRVLETTEGLDLGDLTTFYRAAKKQFDSDATFQEAARQAVVKLQAGDAAALQAWKIVCDLSNRTNRKIFDLMGLSDKIQERGESFYNSFLPKTLEALDELGLMVEDEGARCVFLEGFTNKEGKPLPLIVQKSDGGYNYAATDLSAIRYRVDVDRAQRVVYPVGVEQTNHFLQIFQVGKRAGWIADDHEFIHLPLGLILGEDGKKLKSRSGDAPRMVDLLNEAIDYARSDLQTRLQAEGRQESPEFIEHAARVVGISAIKYADLSQSLTSNYIFNLGRMLALQGNTAPYMLYAYVRVQGISRKGGIDFQQFGTDAEIVLQAEEELVLAKHLLQLDEVLTVVVADLFPHRLCEYLFELSQKFNRFYDRCPILQAEEPQRTSRLILADLTARTIKLGLSLLGIPVLERM